MCREIGARRAPPAGVTVLLCPHHYPQNSWCCTAAPRGKDAAGYPVPIPPAFERIAPTAPDWLDSDGADEWERVTDDLAPLGLLKNSDRAVLVAHCEAWSRYVTAVKQYRAEGVTLVNPDSGRTRHPAVAVAEVAAMQMAKLGGLLGLSPVAERGLGTFAPPDDGNNAFGG